MKTTIVITVSKKEALERVRTNRDRHLRIVKEARIGYVKKARELLSIKLGELCAGKLVQLRFNLSMPEDHTEEYDVAIEMLRLHQGDTIKMETIDVRTLMMDDWDWLATFLWTNGAYAMSALDYAQSKGMKLPGE